MDDINAKQKAIQAIIDCDKEYLTPAEVAPILGVDPHAIRVTARQRPDLLKFEFELSGNRTKIPRIPFLQYIGIDVDNLTLPKKTHSNGSPFENKPMTNEELLVAITYQINEFKREINDRLEAIENQNQDLNNVLQSARAFIGALTGNNADK